jgi:folate-binding protein YgfZ
VTDAKNNFYYATDLQVLRVIGDKAAALLHGQLTNAITDLAPGAGNCNLLLTNKGKVLADVHVLNRGTFFDLLTESKFLTLLTEHLSKLAPLSRCTVSHVPSLKVFHVVGEALEGFPELALGEMKDMTMQDQSCLVFRSDRLRVKGFDVVLESEAVGRLESVLTAAGVKKIGVSDVESLRVKNGVPRLGMDVTDANFPQEGRLEHALHFKKGCYLGQEIIARLHFRGHVTKLLTHFESEISISPQTPIANAQGEPVGVVTSSAMQNGKTYLLGYVPYKSVEAGDDFFVAQKILKRLS